MKSYFFFTCFILVSICNAQHEKEIYINKAIEICPDADIIEIELKDDYIEIEYLCDDKLYEIGLNPDKEVVFIETEADISKTPLDKIHKKLKKKYYGWVLDEYTYVKMPDTAFYIV